jgi:HAD superfamily hydrolase (TIGR01549 family)
MFKKILVSIFVKNILWDFDGTLYQSKILGNILEKEFRKIASSNKKFNRLVSIGYSWSAATSTITGINEFTLLDTVDKIVDKRKYVHPNPSIVNLINRTKNRYHHYIVTNSTQKEVIDCLKIIGFDQKHPFVKIYSRDTTQFLKPNPKILQQVVHQTHTFAFQNVFIGDSINHDIIPAQNIGMFTCPIWEINHLF